MPTVAKSIGTSGRDYSTITAWEADLSNASVYSSGDTAQGTCFADSVFTENVTISDASAIPTNIQLTAADGQKHDGTAGSGVVVKPSTDASYIINVQEPNTDVSFLEINGNGVGRFGFYCTTSVTGVVLRNCLIHNIRSTGTSGGTVSVMRNRSGMTFMNNFVFNCTSGSTGGMRVHDTEASVVTNIFNSTYYYLPVADDEEGAAFLFYQTLRTTGATAKNILAYRYHSFSVNPILASATADYWGAVGAITNVTNLTAEPYADAFVDTSTSDPDLHLKTGTDLIGAGVDLGTTPTNVNLDIDGGDRDAAGTAWDLGADQYNLVPTSSSANGKYSSRFNLFFFGAQGLGSFSTV
jgi:hypothetical protein